MLATLLPTALLVWYLSDPSHNQPIVVRLEHFVITSNVSVVAAVVAFLVARAALGVGQYRALLIALGFGCMAAIFSVHGLATPGVLEQSDREAPAQLVLGVSAQLALAVAAVFFAARYTPLAGWLERRLRPEVLTIAVVAFLALYAFVGLGWPNEFAGISQWILSSGGAAAGYQPSAYGYGAPASSDVTGGAGWVPFAIVAAVLVMYGYSAVAQGRDFIRTGLPLQGALAFAYVLLAQAQVSQFLGPIWTPSWWEYHGLMLAAVVLAMGALVLELDRRRGLERFLPATVVERVIQGDPLRLEGERQTVTILFTDLRGSTSLAERLTPEQTIAAVNSYLRVMARCVIDNGGILDKFTGDGVMAIFGALSDPTNGALSAARAALAMRASIADLNAARAARGDVVVQFGMGLHTGDVVVGAVGLPERSQYDAIGDAVNTASRMETLTKEYRVDSILSKDTAERLGDDGVALRPLGEAHVKGKANAIEVFTLA